MVYAGSQDKNVYALDALSGKLIWKFATGGSIEDSPAVADGLVYIESDDGYVYCLNAQPWGTQLAHLRRQQPALHLRQPDAYLFTRRVGGMVYIGSLDGNLYALTRTRARWFGRLLRADQSSVRQPTLTAPSTSLLSSPQPACSSN